MLTRVLRPLPLCVLFLLPFAITPAAHADIMVVKGSDYLQTTAGTSFGGVAFEGVPIGPGNTDTIVQRLDDTTLMPVGGSDTIHIELAALDLVSTAPTNFGLGVGLYYITLQSARGGPESTGQMTINLDSTGPVGGTFSSFFDVFFDIRLGSETGPIAQSGDLVLSNSGTSWSNLPPPDAVIVMGPVGDQDANLHTGLAADQVDFFNGPISEQHPTGAQHNVIVATPEPTAVLLLVSVVALLGSRFRQTR